MGYFHASSCYFQITFFSGPLSRPLCLSPKKINSFWGIDSESGCVFAWHPATSEWARENNQREGLARKMDILTCRWNCRGRNAIRHRATCAHEGDHRHFFVNSFPVGITRCSLQRQCCDVCLGRWFDARFPHRWLCWRMCGHGCDGLSGQNMGRPIQGVLCCAHVIASLCLRWRSSCNRRV